MSRIILSDYPGIRRAALTIAYDNGMINREESESDFIRNLEKRMSECYSPILLSSWSNWLLMISDDAINTVCCGEECESGKLLDYAPHRNELENLLNFIFEDQII